MTLEGFLLGVATSFVGTIVSIVIVFLVFQPHVRFAPRIQEFAPELPPTLRQRLRLRRDRYWRRGGAGDAAAHRRYAPSFRVVGVVRVLDVQTLAWIHIDVSGRSADHVAVPVPLSASVRPALPTRKSPVQTPRLVLERVDWPAYVPPSLWPRDPLDLRRVLDELNATLVIHVSATTAAFQVTWFSQHSYGADDIGDQTAS